MKNSSSETIVRCLSQGILQVLVTLEFPCNSQQGYLIFQHVNLLKKWRFTHEDESPRVELIEFAFSFLMLDKRLAV